MIIKEITNLSELKSKDKDFFIQHFLENYTREEIDSLFLENDEAFLIGGFIDEDLVSILGLIKGSGRTEEIVPNDQYFLQRVFTKAEHRNKGYIKQLIEYTHKKVKDDLGLKEIWMDSTKAGEFYEKNFNYKYQFSLPWLDMKTKFYKKEL